MDLSKFDGHTSGPWVSQDASQPDCPFFYVRVAATGEWIVMVCDTEKRGHESTEANARLIAAAPNLLAEVRRLATLVERMRGIIADWNCWEDDPRGAAFALRNTLLAELDAKPKEG